MCSIQLSRLSLHCEYVFHQKSNKCQTYELSKSKNIQSHKTSQMYSRLGLYVKPCLTNLPVTVSQTVHISFDLA